MTDKLSQIRAQLPAVQDQVFLNTGWYGPLPDVTMQAIKEATTYEYQHGRPTRANIERRMTLGADVRQGFATLINAAPEDLALTHHTTDGMNIVTHGFNWQPGDEVTTTSIEHEAGVFPFYAINQRFGVKINFADVGLGAEPLAAIDAALTPKTRLLSISAVSYSCGARFPMKEVIELAHAKNIPVIVDGAQSAGAFALDMQDLDVDFYAIPGQKWLCGPEGIGALYIRPDHLETLYSTYTNFFAIQEHDWNGTYTFNPTAARHDTGTIYPAVQAGMKASLDWFTNVVEPQWAYDRIAHIASYACEKIGALDGVTITTPANRQASLVNFLPVGWSPLQMTGLVSMAEAQGYIYRNIGHQPYAVRVSCGFFNTEAEIDSMVDCLGEILAAGPDAVEIPEWTKDYNMSTEPIYEVG